MLRDRIAELGRKVIDGLRDPRHFSFSKAANIRINPQRF
jgi:hypothetical protein